MRHLLLAAILLAGTVSAADARTHGGYSSASPVSVSPSATTIYASWAEATSGNTTLACGTSPGVFDINAVDNGTQSGVTHHTGIVAGLTPSTTYYCQAVGTGTFQFTVATTALPSSTALVSATIGASPTEPVSNQMEGDTFYSAQSDDGITYTTADDNNSFGNGTSTSMMFGKYTNLSPLTGSNINTMVGNGWGTLAQCTGDSPGRSWKALGLTSYSGTLYAFVSRQSSWACTPYPGNEITAQWSGSILKSIDKGLNWANFQAPTTYNNAVPSPASSLMFGKATTTASAITAANPGVVTTASAHGFVSNWMTIKVTGANPTCYNGTYTVNVTDTTHFSLQADTSGCGAYVGGAQITPANQVAALTPLIYGVDDDTLGYRVDDADAYVYAYYTDFQVYNASHLYLARVPRAKIGNLAGADWQYFTGGDGNLDSNWSSNLLNASAILTSASQVSIPSVVYMPATGRYVMNEWYYPDPNTTNNTVWNVYEMAHPWSAPTLIATKTWTPSGFYNPAPIPSTAVSATANGNAMTLVFSGDYTTCCASGGYYHLFTTTEVLNTH